MHHQYSAEKIVWWRKDSRENKLKKVEHSFKMDFIEFIHNFTLHCYRWLVEPNQHSWELYVYPIVIRCCLQKNITETENKFLMFFFVFPIYAIK